MNFFATDLHQESQLGEKDGDACHHRYFGSAVSTY